MHVSVPAAALPTRRRFRWRVVDIVTASVIGVAAGVVFWLWGQAWTPLSTVLGFLPGLDGLMAGGWLFAGVVGGLVVRKPGAALYTEVVAAVVEMAIGNQWGPSSFIWGLFEGLGAEIGFALFLYGSGRLIVAMVSGAVAGVATGILDTNFSSVAALALPARAIYFVSSVVSGIVLAGVVGWLIVRALARTGALDRFSVGRELRRREADAPDAA